MTDYSETLINNIRSLNSLDECYDLIESELEKVQDFEELDLNLFKYKNTYFRTGKVFNLGIISDNLKLVSGMNLSCAPELDDVIILKNNDDMVLITRVPGSEACEFKKYIRFKDEIGSQDRKQLIDDFEKMALKGFYNPAMTDSVSNWYIIPDTKKIYIDKWAELIYFENESQKEEKRKSLYEMCEM